MPNGMRNMISCCLNAVKLGVRYGLAFAGYKLNSELFRFIGAPRTRWDYHVTDPTLV